MTKTITDENLAEYLQPILDEAQKGFVKSLGEAHEKLSGEVLAKAAEQTKVALEAKPADTKEKGDDPPEVDLTDLDAVEAHVAVLRKAKDEKVDITDLESVEAHAKAMRKAKDEKVDITDIESVKRHLAKLEAVKAEGVKDSAELAKAKAEVAKLEQELGKSNQTPGDPLRKSSADLQSECGDLVTRLSGNINAKRGRSAGGE